MDKEEALEILSMIADGLDPYGEDDPSKNLPEINPVTIRAICTALTYLLSGKDRENLKSNYRTKKLEELIESVNGPLQLYLKEKEKEEIIKALGEASLNFDKAAEILGITKSELEHKIEVLDLKKEIHIRILMNNVERDYFNIVKSSSLDQYLEIIEKNAIKRALDETDHNQNHAAEKLGITFRSFRYRVDKYDVGYRDLYFDNRVNADYFHFSRDYSLNEFLQKVEKKIIKKALKEKGNNKNQAAGLLGTSFRSFRYRIEKLGIE